MILGIGPARREFDKWRPARNAVGARAFKPPSQIPLFLQHLDHPDGHHDLIICDPPSRLTFVELSGHGTHHRQLGALLALPELVMQYRLDFFHRLCPRQTSSTRFRFHYLILAIHDPATQRRAINSHASSEMLQVMCPDATPSHARKLLPE